MKAILSFFLTLCGLGFLLVLPARALYADTDCLSCHNDPTLQDASGHSIGVNADKFHASVHAGLKDRKSVV